MRTILRTLSSLTAAVGLTALLVSAAVAGNYAEVTMLDAGAGDDTPVTADQARELRFELLQHGVTPVEFGAVTVTATLAGTDEVVNVAATSAGDGIWTATVTFPVDGEWQLRIVHSVLETPAASSFAVGPAASAGFAPGAAAIGGTLALAAVLLLVATRLGRRPTAPAAEGITQPAG